MSIQLPKQAGREDCIFGATENRLRDSWRVLSSFWFAVITKSHLQNTESLHNSVTIDTNKQIREHFWAISHIAETYLTAQVALDVFDLFIFLAKNVFFITSHKYFNKEFLSYFYQIFWIQFPQWKIKKNQSFAL